MYLENLLVGLLLALLSLSGFFLAVWQAKNWIRDAGILDRLRRAVLTGVGTELCFISGAIALDYLRNPTSEKNWDILALGSLTCLSFPLMLITTFGSFYRYMTQDSIERFFSNRLKNIVDKSKK